MRAITILLLSVLLMPTVTHGQNVLSQSLGYRAVQAQGKIWFVFDGDVIRYDAKRETGFRTRISDRVGQCYHSRTCDDTNGIDSVHMPHMQVWTSATTPLGCNGTRAVRFDARGALWMVGSNGVVSRKHNNDWSTLILCQRHRDSLYCVRRATSSRGVLHVVTCDRTISIDMMSQRIIADVAGSVTIAGATRDDDSLLAWAVDKTPDDCFWTSWCGNAYMDVAHVYDVDADQNGTIALGTSHGVIILPATQATDPREPERMSFDVSPNPASMECRVVLNAEPADQTYLDIVASNGTIVQTQRIMAQVNTVNISGLSGGMYTLVIRSARERRSSMLSVIR